MKKANILIMSILILVIMTSNSYAFSDTYNHWATETIEKMQEYKVINGYTDGTFKPNKEMSRAEFVKLVSTILNLEKVSYKYIPDITRQDWYYSEIRKAVAAGIIMGDEEGYVHPNQTITREEAIVILARAFKITVCDNINNSFLDEDQISDWAKKDMITFSKNGYISGYDDGMIKPKSSITRAEAVTIIDRIIPNIIKADVYEGIIHGNTLVYDNNVTLKNLVIDGSLIVPEKYQKTLVTKFVEVKQNLVLSNSSNKNAESVKDINVEKNIFGIYDDVLLENINYINEEYGIRFAIPSTMHTVELSTDSEIDYTEKDLIVIDIKNSEEYYKKNIRSIGLEETKKYANLFGLIEEGKLHDYEYILYKDNENAQMLIIKRGRFIYNLIFFNVISENLVDNVLATMEFMPIEGYVESQNQIYKNSTLSLKFTYKDIYVVVDDSYNTQKVNTDNGIFKLFIQVNTITDMQNYSMPEIRSLLTSLVQNDGTIIEKEILKIMNNDAVKFKIKSEEKMLYSLYVIVGNNLYNFIFTGEEEAMNEVGESIFNDMIHTLEF